MNAAQLTALLDPALTRLAESRDELRDLDAAIGDGDLGVTISNGSTAVRKALSEVRPEQSPVDVLRSVAQAFAKANPSTMSGLVAGGLLASARTLGDVDGLDRAAAIILLRTAIAAIQARGGAVLGDKTIVDAMIPSLDALENSTEEPAPRALVLMITAAQTAVERTTSMQSRRGRAAWVGARTVGHPDGGAIAYLRFLQALAAVWPA